MNLGMEQMAIAMFADGLEMFVGYVSSCCNIHQVRNYMYSIFLTDILHNAPLQWRHVTIVGEVENRWHNLITVWCKKAALSITRALYLPAKSVGVPSGTSTQLENKFSLATDDLSDHIGSSMLDITCIIWKSTVVVKLRSHVAQFTLTACRICGKQLILYFFLC